MQLYLTQSAIEDLQQLKRYYAEQGVPDVGIALVQRILETLELTLQHPELGRIVPEFNQPELREILQPPFRLVYWRQVEQIHVVRVWRSERLLTLPDPPQ